MGRQIQNRERSDRVAIRVNKSTVHPVVTLPVLICRPAIATSSAPRPFARTSLSKCHVSQVPYY